MNNIGREVLHPPIYSIVSAKSGKHDEVWCSKNFAFFVQLHLSTVNVDGTLAQKQYVL